MSLQRSTDTKCFKGALVPVLGANEDEPEIVLNPELYRSRGRQRNKIDSMLMIIIACIRDNFV